MLKNTEKIKDYIQSFLLKAYLSAIIRIKKFISCFLVSTTLDLEENWNNINITFFYIYFFIDEMGVVGNEWDGWVSFWFYWILLLLFFRHFLESSMNFPNFSDSSHHPLILETLQNSKKLMNFLDRFQFKFAM